MAKKLNTYKMMVSGTGWLCGWMLSFRNTKNPQYEWVPLIKLTSEQLVDFTTGTADRFCKESLEAVLV